MQQVGEAMIVIIGRGTGDVAEHVLPLRRLADLLQIVVAFVGENVLAKFQHGVCPSGAAAAVAAGGVEHRLDDRLIAGAAADIAADGVDDVFTRRGRIRSSSAFAAISMPGVQ